MKGRWKGRISRIDKSSLYLECAYHQSFAETFFCESITKFELQYLTGKTFQILYKCSSGIQKGNSMYIKSNILWRLDNMHANRIFLKVHRLLWYTFGQSIIPLR